MSEVLFGFERYSIGDFLGMPFKNILRERRLLKEKEMLLLGFSSAHLEKLGSEEGPNDCGEWVKIWRVNYLTVVK